MRGNGSGVPILPDSHSFVLPVRRRGKITTQMEPAASSDAGNAADLVRRIRAGDRQAEAELVQRYSRGVTMMVRREARNLAVSDDLYQETFRIAIEKVRQGDLRESEKLAAFICSVARNLAVEYYRRAARHESLTETAEADRPHYFAPNQLDALLQQEKADIVRQVINELPTDRDRQLVFRFYIAEDDKEKICADLGLSSLHFNRVLHRARERYKELYEKAVSTKK
jgi:RNA polymerase sigma-70 factor, ECF subfamily